MIHACPECQLLHDAGQPPAEDPAVAIARIEAENRLAIARLESRSDVAVAGLVAEAQADVAEAEAGATVAAMELQAAAVAEVYANSDPEPPVMDPPIVIEQNNDQDNEGDEFEPPEVEHEAPKPQKRGLGLW